MFLAEGNLGYVGGSCGIVLCFKIFCVEKCQDLEKTDGYRVVTQAQRLLKEGRSSTVSLKDGWNMTKQELRGKKLELKGKKPEEQQIDSRQLNNRIDRFTH